jgi:transcriptional regulator with XRE-family HTH domain
MTSRKTVRYCHTCGTRLARDNRLTRCATCQRKASDLAAGPPQPLPPGFWTDQVMADALRSWHIGQVIRAYRHHPAHGPRPLCQELVAGWLGLTQTQLSRTEKGLPIKDLGKLIAWATVLRIPDGLLWFKLPREPRTSPPESDTPAPPLLSTRDHQSTGKAPAEMSDQASQSAMLAEAYRSFEGPVTDFLGQQLRRSKADDGSFGPAMAMPLVLAVIDAVSQRLRDARPGTRTQLLALGADGAEFVGWLYRDLDDPASATSWYDRAMEWAQAANDTSMQGYVLLKKSQMAYDQRDAQRVSMFAQAAQHGPWQLPARIRAEVTQQEAVGMAMLGEPISAVERKTEQARQFLTRADDLTDSYFTLETLSLRSAACYTEAGKPARAAQMFDQIISKGTLSRRDVGFFSARRAAALALSGEPDEAAAVGLAAFQVAQDTRSERTLRVLGEVVRTLQPWSSRPGPRALKEIAVA